MSYLEQLEIDEINRLCDLIRYQCAFCGEHDMHGLPVTELIGSKEVVTHVICRKCCDKPVRMDRITRA